RGRLLKLREGLELHLAYRWCQYHLVGCGIGSLVRPLCVVANLFRARKLILRIGAHQVRERFPIHHRNSVEVPAELNRDRVLPLRLVDGNIVERSGVRIDCDRREDESPITLASVWMTLNGRAHAGVREVFIAQEVTIPT